VLTLFAVPKPFRGHISIIQRNAIRSWTLLRPACQIILFGDEEGTAEVAAEFGVKHVPDVARNEYGTPLVSDIFEQAQRRASHDLLCYINADIVLMSDFTAAVRRVTFRRFLLVGQRWDVDLDEPWNFEDPQWETHLREYARSHGKLHPPYGIDYFVFTRGLWEAIPPFAIGRPAWDNWMIFSARTSGAAVIDATKAILAIHQNHEYAHVPHGVNGTWEGPEAERNRAMRGSYSNAFTAKDATWQLTSRWLVPALARDYLRHRGERLTVLGFRAHEQGRLKEACVYLLKAACFRPWLLGNLAVLSILIEPIVGTRLMAWCRQQRHKVKSR